MYSYRLTPTSLRRATRQGVELGRIVDFLREVADEHGLPPSLLGALQRWARAGSEAAIQDLTVLRLKSPELLETLQRTPKIQECLDQPLGPAAVGVRRDRVERLRAVLAELGILSD
jgi:transposase-like protein